MGKLKITHTDFIAMFTNDFAKTSDFYKNVLGLKFSKIYNQIPGGEMETGNLTIQLLEAKSIGREFSPGQPIAFNVDDVAQARSDLEALGVKFSADTMDSGVCFQAYFADPDGNPLILHHRYAPEGQRPGDPS